MIKILISKKYKGKSQYLVTRKDNSQDLIDADNIDKTSIKTSITTQY